VRGCNLQGRALTTLSTSWGWDPEAIAEVRRLKRVMRSLQIAMDRAAWSVQGT